MKYVWNDSNSKIQMKLENIMELTKKMKLRDSYDERSDK